MVNGATPAGRALSNGAATEGPLVGRAAELAQLDGYLGRVAAGSPRPLLVEGELGIGKTRLLDELRLHAVGRGIQVLWGTETRPGRAGKPLRGLRRTAEELASHGPVLVLADDVHRANGVGLAGLRKVLRRYPRLPLAVIAAYRPYPRPPGYEELVADLLGTDGQLMRLAPLDDDAIDAIAVGFLDQVPGAQLRQWLAGSGGNPLFAIEMVRGLASEGRLDFADGEVAVRGSGLPEALRTAVLRAANELSEDARHALRIAAVLGTSFAVQQLAAVSGRTAAQLLPSLEEAISAGILTGLESRLAFRHELVREALHDEIPAAIQAGLHLDAARRLADLGAPAAEVGRHLELGALPGDAMAVSLLRDVAGRTASHAPGAAAGLLERALIIAGPADRRRGMLLAELASCRAWSGRPADAAELARTTLSSAHGPQATAAARLALSQALYLQGRTAEALREGELAALAPGLPEALRAQCLAHVALARVTALDLPGAHREATKARRSAENCSDDLTRAAALSALSAVAAMRADPASAIALAAAARPQRGEPFLEHCWPSQLFLGLALSEAGRLAEAESAIREGHRLAMECGAGATAPLHEQALAALHYRAGRWDKALTAARSAVAAGERAGIGLGMAATHALIARIAVHRNELRAARGALASAEQAVRGDEAAGRAQCSEVLCARALLAEAAGDRAPALARLEQAWRRWELGGVTARQLGWGPWLVRLLMCSGQPERARRLAAQVQQIAAGLTWPGAAIAELRCRGLAAGTAGDLDLLGKAAEHTRVDGRPLRHASACEDVGRALARRGRAVEAVPLLTEALTGYERLGATRDAARLKAQLRALGIRGSPSRPRPGRPATGWRSLTPAERRVVRLVVEGLTNQQAAQRLFVSPRTVESHLSHVFAKLGIGSRAALIAEAGASGAGRSGPAAAPWLASRADSDLAPGRNTQ